MGRSVLDVAFKVQSVEERKIFRSEVSYCQFSPFAWSVVVPKYVLVVCAAILSWSVACQLLSDVQLCCLKDR